MPTRPAGLMPALRRVVLASAADRSDGQLLAAFIADRDADAFGALVRRHGPMVLGVCRRVVRDRATADDAFQAVFLVLARRAAGVRPRERVGNWLYGVAHRTALKARAVLARRRSREKQVDPMPEPAAAPPAAWADLRPVIDEELARLPEKFRTPVVLCDLEGRPQREVARQLGLPPATLATRLAAARRTLAARLTRRGVVLSGGAVAALLTTHGTAAAVPPAVVHALVRAVEAGGAVLPGVSAAAVQLSEGVIRMMLLTKLKAVAVLGLTVAALSGGLGLGLVPAVAAGDDPPPARAVRVMPIPQPPAAVPPPAPVDDLTFLRRLTLDLRGTLPTDLERLLFVADGDENKRAKLVDWLLADGKPHQPGRVRTVAFSPDGKVLAFESADPPGRLNLNVVGPDDKPADVLYRFQPVDVGAPRAFGLLSAGPDGTVRVWDADTGRLVTGGDAAVRLWETSSGDLVRTWVRAADRLVTVAESDADFLRRVTQAARGSAPTALEEKYFAGDKDPGKREKLLDLLLKEPGVAKKLGDDFKKRMLAGPAEATREQTLRLWDPVGGRRLVVPLDPEGGPAGKPAVVPPTPAVPPPADPFGKLIDELLAAKKTDAEVLEALTLVTAGRLPTDVEKRLTLGLVGKAADRKAAWAEVAKALAGDAKKDVIRKVVAPPPVPVPPAK